MMSACAKIADAISISRKFCPWPASWPPKNPPRRTAANNWRMPCEISPAGTLVTVADYTRTELIVPRLRECDPAGIVEELSQRLRAQAIIGDVLSFYQAVVNHEFLSNSALPAGIATPHARSAQVSRLTLAVGRTR